ncbi:hypothetical protein NDN08_003732 [Rhodosorus marinus]|uniref:D-xylose 1-dehydrogenase (NADP(+), D-xylono-1,5-lactone-forming) n=1 Tax=Rhodosorus marinus TaxID=101924 RepID=A0AAV8UXC9_9RHOD|nr:hypothetical protein NDN08_003732 [Rhodosorus marinus]
MADHGDFDIMYIGTLHPFHREHAQAALEAGKHVLVEKPFTTTLDDALALTELAEKKGLFIAEGLWTRFFPAVEQALHMVRSGSLGEVKQVEADFCFNATADGDAGVLFNKELAGGANFYVSIYSLGYATAVFGTEPEKIIATGHVQEGLDLSNVVVLLYADGKTGIAISGMHVESAEETRISGTNGRITIHPPSHCATSTTFYGKLEGRGNVETHTVQFDLPRNPPTLEETGGFNFPNSIGFQYEAAAAMRCIHAGRRETPQYTTSEMLGVQKLQDQVRKQLHERE